MKKRFIVLAATVALFNNALAANEDKVPAPTELTAEQVAKLKEMLKADVVNWEALDPKDFIARNELGEQVPGVMALIHTKKGIEDYKSKIKGKVDEKTAKVAYEIEKSSIIVLQCKDKVASIHTITPANGKVPALGESKPLNPLQVEALAEHFCK